MINLDRRIKDEYTPLTCFTSDFIMRDFIGKECYFSDNAYDFTDLSVFEGGNSMHSTHFKGILKGLAYTDSPFIAFASEEEVISFKYCLPCDYVRRPGK